MPTEIAATPTAIARPLRQLAEPRSPLLLGAVVVAIWLFMLALDVRFPGVFAGIADAVGP